MEEDNSQRCLLLVAETGVRAVKLQLQRLLQAELGVRGRETFRYLLPSPIWHCAGDRHTSQEHLSALQVVVGVGHNAISLLLFPTLLLDEQLLLRAPHVLWAGWDNHLARRLGGSHSWGAPTPSLGREAPGIEGSHFILQHLWLCCVACFGLFACRACLAHAICSPTFAFGGFQAGLDLAPLKFTAGGAVTGSQGLCGGGGGHNGLAAA